MTSDYLNPYKGRGVRRNPDEPMRVIGYVRVSTDRQEVGPEVQMYALSSWAEIMGGIALDVRREDAVSAASMKKRPVLQQALRDLREGRADMLAVSKLDRLSRSVKDFSTILADAEREGWHVSCLDLGVDTSSSNGRLLAHVTASVAQFERERIGERTREAMARIKAETGKHMGRPPEVSAEAIDRAAFLYGLGLTLAEVGEQLTEEGIKTPRGGKWWPDRVAEVLERAGVQRRGRNPHLPGRPKKQRPSDEEAA